MTDRVHPSTKTTTNGAATTTAAAATATNANPSFPASKSQLYGANRLAYRPQPQRKRSRRNCCCAVCFWVTLIIVSLLLLAAIFGAILYAIYRPHRPSFTVSGLKVSTLNLTSSSQLITNINLNITTRNPNKNLVYSYKPASITISTEADDIVIGTGSLPSFVHGVKNTTLLKASITSTGQALDDTTASQLKTDLKSKNGVALKIKLGTKVKAKMGGWLKTPEVGIRVSCDGIKAMVPTGKTATTASVSTTKCEVDLRIKIWKWTF